MKHVGDCAKDESARQVCEGMYSDKCHDVHVLHEALRAVYALAGEEPQVAKICQDAIKETGGDI